ncbi:hypothetical protein [Rufibacter psychrotolerans]|uniref:hypothetical protein n=1 Tax=Rufibacter psychrotolerans TaxID=2812556 RepID=UPI0019687C8D|nr:hypothetical protein [Rufibacter sp. SYSU D00308]
MNLLFLTFGPNIKNHYQANFAILSFLPYLPEGHRICVYTDYPQFYQHLHERVTTIAVTKEQFTDWEGPHRFFWRVKIKAIEHLIQQFPTQPVMYLDSDVFLYRNPQELSQQLAAGKAFMHVCEGKLSELRSKTEKRMWQQVKGMDFGRFKLAEHHHMWNAGVVMVPAQKNQEAISLALQVCDTLCARHVTPRLIEQFALSVALEETYGLQEAKPWIAHYWGNKDEWNERISQFFLESYLQGLTLAQDIARVQQFDYKPLALVKRPKNTRKRLMNVVDRLFPVKPETFIEE